MSRNRRLPFNFLQERKNIPKAPPLTSYNPILGEVFRCRYDYEDGTCGYYVAEQVSHHPPISAFYYVSPDHKVVIRGELRPKSKFLGNSAANMMEGANKISFLDRPQDGEYNITMPNMYARGILFGKVRLKTDALLPRVSLAEQIDTVSDGP